MAMEFVGHITQVRFYAPDTHYIVCSVQTEQQEREVLMTGYMKDYSEHKTYRFEGEFIVHPRYGKQFKIDRYQEVMASDRIAVIRYLSSPLFSGVGPTLASCIVDTLGDRALSMIEEDPNCLDQVRGMNQTRKDEIVRVLKEENESQESLQFLMGNGLSLKLATRIYAFYESSTIDVVTKNPYVLIEDVEGVGFKTADQLAMRLSFDIDHPYRLEACMLYTLKQLCMDEGCVYVNYEKLCQEFLKSCPFVEEGKVIEIISELIHKDEIVLEDERYYPKSLYEAEINISNILKRYINGVSDMDADFEDVEEILEDFEKRWNIQYDTVQQDAIYSFLENDLMILTGGPGTGKTTIVKAMLELYKKINPNHTIALVASTGRAAKRLSEACNTPASTIHRLLQWDVHQNVFNKDREHPIEADLLVIDEFSMVDTFLFSQLLNACTNVQKILLIGDEAQLPSIAPGQVLYDLISSNKIETICLKQIFRQHESSGIVQITHALREDEAIDFSMFNDYKDIHFLPCREEDVQRFVSKIIKKAYHEGYDIYDFQVLVPMYSGIAGIDAINECLQNILNPKDELKSEVKYFSKIFREGDKVLQLKNRPDDNVFNGDIGIIVEIETRVKGYAQDVIHVDFEGDLVSYTSNDFNQLTLAYCMSIHKAQGSEFKIVVMPLVMRYMRMLKKNLIYTGMTRAKQSLFLIGQQEAFEYGLKQTEVKRNTTLQKRMLANKKHSLYDYMD